MWRKFVSIYATKNTNKIIFMVIFYYCRRNIKSLLGALRHKIHMYRYSYSNEANHVLGIFLYI